MTALTEAAGILLTRGDAPEEVFLVTRAPSLRVMGGFVAIPGGKVAPEDVAMSRPDLHLDAHHVAAVREVFEETGILIARDDWGRQPASSPELAVARKALLDGTTTFAALLASFGLSIDPADLTFGCRLVTPAFSPVRFDTSFYVAALPPRQHAEVWPGELTAGFWMSPRDALRRRSGDDFFLTPPAATMLEAISDAPAATMAAGLAPLMARIDAGLIPPIRFHPGVFMVPLDCKGLPPTTHTNTLLVGTGPKWLIDPGPVDPSEQAKLFDALGDERPDGVILSHHHPDHVGASDVCRERFGVPVYAHRNTKEILGDRVRIDRFIEDDEVIPLGDDPDGSGPWSMQAMHTPGHAPGHLAFFEPRHGLLFAGDMVSPLSSMIVAPDDGDLLAYIRSLETLLRLPIKLLIPAHGPATLRPHALLEENLSHRRTRDAQIRELLSIRPRTIDEIALELYRGFPENVLKLARLQIHSGLIALERTRFAERVGGVWGRRGDLDTARRSG